MCVRIKGILGTNELKCEDESTWVRKDRRVSVTHKWFDTCLKKWDFLLSKFARVTNLSVNPMQYVVVSFSGPSNKVQLLIVWFLIAAGSAILFS